MNSKIVWDEISASATTAEELRCVGEAEENAAESCAYEGYVSGSENYYRLMVSTYEFLMDTGEYASEGR